MTEPILPKLDRSTFVVTSLTASSGDKEYWLNQSSYQRLAAIETMRQIVYGYNPLTTRLQRILEVTQRT